MKRNIGQLLKASALGLVLSFAVMPVAAQDKQNTTTGEIKKSGSEAKKAGTSLGSNMKHGRVVRGGKHFGKHVGRAGKHAGRSTKKLFKKVIS